MRKLVAIVISFALLAPACPPAPTPPDSGTADAGASPCALACAHLAELGCAEGNEVNCVAVCEHAERDRLTPMHPDCLAAAPSKDAARACKSVRCP